LVAEIQLNFAVIAPHSSKLEHKVEKWLAALDTQAIVPLFGDPEMEAI
jgi:hypothetical protein